MIFSAVLGYAGSYAFPKTYIAKLRLLPPQTNSMTASVLLGQVGGATSLGSSALGLKNPGDLYAGILKSRAVIKPVIEKHDLVNGYKVKTYDDAERRFLNNLKITAGKDGILELEIVDTVPVRASNSGNSIIESMYTLSRDLTSQESDRREMFHERLVAAARVKLNEAEDRLLAEEKMVGLSRIKGQEEGLSSNLAELQSAILQKEYEIASIMRYATPHNLELSAARRELARLRGFLKTIRERPALGLGGSNQGLDSTDQALLDRHDRITRIRRDISMQEKVLESAIRVAEAARVDDQRDLSIIQVLDYADPPRVASGPNRVLGAIFGLIGGFLASVIFILMADAIMSDPARLQRWQKVKDAFGFNFHPNFGSQNSLLLKAVRKLRRK